MFLRLGVTAFGGPAAHIAAMEDECVERRGWVTRSEFVDLVGVTNLIPGPNSTELAIHIGYRYAGWPGLLIAGAAFIIPATVMVWVIAVMYVRYGTRPEVTAMLVGMQPVVLAVVAQAIWRLSKTVLRGPVSIGITLASVASIFAGVHELAVLGIAAIAGALLVRRITTVDHHGALPSLVGVPTLWPSLWQASVFAAPTSLSVFGGFLKIGSVLFGSGYVLLAFLRTEFVERHSWLTEAQVLDAIAIGQVTPGPVFTSATFVGYLLAGHAGAASATLGIFLPAFFFVAISGPLVRRIRHSLRASAALDAITAASLALMFSVLVVMARPVATSVVGVGIFLLAASILIRTNIGAGWMLLAGALVGVARAFLA